MSSGGKKGVRLLVKLVSTAKTGFFYVTEKNPRNTPWKLKLMKFDPKVNKHVLFEEQKLKTRCRHASVAGGGLECVYNLEFEKA
ncbi:hypothetical protein HXX76_003302 [Chlamydomonas incerta]|uniref:Mitochondrial ribosomal protein L33 n=1 Tax=Chlamydomonas incerta TaxID=51695 RepID=A0A835TA83_CHLIN|nr:hypothetical protein HXX76_003302 [Chlamydomonas incerta]|eukprot:KAG2441684.1 hypothetical protein HXX76_003302 [Chlamydomonas incerta]